MGFCIPEDDILHSHCRENLKSYILASLIKQRTRVDIKRIIYRNEGMKILVLWVSEGVETGVAVAAFGVVVPGVLKALDASVMYVDIGGSLELLLQSAFCMSRCSGKLIDIRIQ
jgi:hypothetical protein